MEFVLIGLCLLRRDSSLRVSTDLVGGLLQNKLVSYLIRVLSLVPTKMRPFFFLISLVRQTIVYPLTLGLSYTRSLRFSIDLILIWMGYEL